MALTSKNLSDREKAVLYYHVYSGVDDWQKLYAIADTDPNPPTGNTLNTLVSRWKRSEKVRDCLEAIQKQKADHDADERNKGKEEEREKIERDFERGESDEPTNGNKIVDYSDPENRKRLYNQVIKQAKDDPRTQLDAAKMFEQIQKDDKQAAREQKQVRAYLPLMCHDCPLYQKEREK